MNCSGRSLKVSRLFMKTICLRAIEKHKQSPEVFLKKRCSWHRGFPANFAKFLRTPFSQNTSGRLLRDEFYLKCFLFDLKNNFGILSQKHVLLQSQQWEQQNNVGNMCKITSKDTRQHRFGVYIAKFGYITHLFLVHFLLPWTGKCLLTLLTFFEGFCRDKKIFW